MYGRSQSSMICLINTNAGAASSALFSSLDERGSRAEPPKELPQLHLPQLVSLSLVLFIIVVCVCVFFNIIFWSSSLRRGRRRRGVLAGVPKKKYTYDVLQWLGLVGISAKPRERGGGVSCFDLTFVLKNAHRSPTASSLVWSSPSVRGALRRFGEGGACDALEARSACTHTTTTSLPWSRSQA